MMENSEFEWDEEKAVSNLKKHRVSFEEAATIFNDPKFSTISDPDHSEADERYISPGQICHHAFTECYTYLSKRKNPFDQRQKGNKSREENL